MKSSSVVHVLSRLSELVFKLFIDFFNLSFRGACLSLNEEIITVFHVNY